MSLIYIEKDRQFDINPESKFLVFIYGKLTDLFMLIS